MLSFFLIDCKFFFARIFCVNPLLITAYLLEGYLSMIIFNIFSGFPLDKMTIYVIVIVVK
jgi:hypothetical protein